MTLTNPYVSLGLKTLWHIGHSVFELPIALLRAGGLFPILLPLFFIQILSLKTKYYYQSYSPNIRFMVIEKLNIYK